MSTRVIAGRSFLLEANNNKKEITIHNKESVQKAIKLIELSTILTQKAFDAFLNRRFEELDALVGDNACQIRASLILDLAKKDNDKMLVATMSESIETCKRIQEALNHLDLQTLIPETKISFEEFCKKHNLSLEIPQECEFLLEAFALTQSKTTDSSGSEFSTPENLEHLVEGFSKKDLKNIIRNAQKSLSGRSAKHLQQVSKSKELKQLLEKLVFTDNATGVQGIPCFFGMEALLQKISDDNTPIVIVFKKRNPNGNCKVCKKLLFKSSKGIFNPITIKINPKLKLKDSLKEVLKTPAFVIEGIFDGDKPNLEKFNTLGLQKVVLANVAQHPQFFGVNKNLDPFELPQALQFKSEQEKLSAFKDLAKTEGCSLANQKLFCIEHILCLTIERALESLK